MTEHKCDPIAAAYDSFKRLVPADTAFLGKASADYDCPVCHQRWVVLGYKPKGTTFIRLRSWHRHWWIVVMTRWLMRMT
jgi:hypothetical protein